MKYSLLFALIFAINLSACSLPEVSPQTQTPTNGPSPTVTITPQPTFSPTPIPTNTPVPSLRITNGQKAILSGNYPLARQEFNAAISGSSDGDVQALALWGLAKTDFHDQNYSAALESLRSLTQQFPTSQAGIQGWFLLGEVYFELKRFQESTAAYQNYIQARPGLLDAYIQEKRGDAFSAINDYEEAQKSYQASHNDTGQSNPVNIRIKIANAYLNSNRPDLALIIYDDIFASTSDDYIKAQMDLFSGRALLALNRTDEGYGRWRHAVDNYPLSYDAYSALLGLVLENQAVNEFNRGLVDYYAQKYDVALRAFQNYASKNPNHDGTVLYYMGLTLREMGDFTSAISMWERLIEKYQGNRYWASAWDERAFTQWVYLDDYNGAAQGLVKFSKETNGSPFTSTYLLEAARIYERGNELEKAADLWESLPERFDSDPAMENAWFQGGIARYRMGNFARANKDFQQALLLAKEPTFRARDLLWIGKTYAINNDIKNAHSAWEQSQTADPNGYYSLRAKDLLENRKPFASPPTTNLNFDLANEKIEAASWLRIKFNLPSDTDLTNLGSLKSEPHFRRGEEFWTLGMFDEARQEFETLRVAVKTNPADTFRLGNYLLDLGAYRSGITAIRDVLTLAGLDDNSASLTAPIYFKHVRFGLYYSDLIWPAASETAIDPLFVTSIIRQESLFEGFVRSEAGARGLMQIIPSTGASIATQIGWPPDFSAYLLYSPYVSIRLGTYYLNANQRLLNGDLFATLAAYNGGPGNASIWQKLANNDFDLELEIIRYGETRDYIRGIYETYSIYRSLYSPMQ